MLLACKLGVQQGGSDEAFSVTRALVTAFVTPSGRHHHHHHQPPPTLKPSCNPCTFLFPPSAKSSGLRYQKQRRYHCTFLAALRGVRTLLRAPSIAISLRAWDSAGGQQGSSDEAFSVKRAPVTAFVTPTGRHHHRHQPPQPPPPCAPKFLFPHPRSRKRAQRADRVLCLCVRLRF